MRVCAGDQVVLFSQDSKSFLITVSEGGVFSTHKGEIAHSELIGREYGEVVKTHMGNPLVILDPTLTDRMMKLKRRTQIIYPKDAAMIVHKTGLEPGMRVIECGTGSGALTMALANAVSPGGMVYTYEWREEFIENARDNVTRAGYSACVEFKHGDANDGFDESEVDVVTLDLPSPWEGIPPAYKAMRGGARLASLSPTYNQIEHSAESLRETGFVHIEAMELLMRRIMARPGKTRPADRMVAHTAFLLFARKALTGGAVFDEK